MFEWDVSPNNLICTNYNSNEGNCVLLKDCKKLFPELKNVESFKENFCVINKGYDNKTNESKPFVLPDELKLDLLWLGNYINSDG